MPKPQWSIASTRRSGHDWPESFAGGQPLLELGEGHSARADDPRSRRRRHLWRMYTNCERSSEGCRASRCARYPSRRSREVLSRAIGLQLGGQNCDESFMDLAGEALAESDFDEHAEPSAERHHQQWSRCYRARESMHPHVASPSVRAADRRCTDHRGRRRSSAVSGGPLPISDRPCATLPGSAQRRPRVPCDVGHVGDHRIDAVAGQLLDADRVVDRPRVDLETDAGGRPRSLGRRTPHRYGWIAHVPAAAPVARASASRSPHVDDEPTGGDLGVELSHDARGLPG